MNASANKITALCLRGGGGVLIVLGGLVFLLGDRLLREVFQFSFMYAEGVGLFSGVILIAIGALLRHAANSIEPEQRTDL